MAQNNQGTVNDSINTATKPRNEDINARTKAVLDSINSGAQRANKNLKESLQSIVPPKPSSYHDTIIFDSLHGQLTIFIRNINRMVGNLHVALFDGYMNFMNNGPPYRGTIVPVTAYTVKVLLDSITRGTYSVAVFHDENKNGVLDKNRLNMPTEGYGFSNNVPSGISPPNYTETKFYYSGKNKTISINMIYFRFPK